MKFLLTMFLVLNLAACGYATPQQIADAEELSQALGCPIKHYVVWASGEVEVVYTCVDGLKLYTLYTEPHFEALR